MNLKKIKRLKKIIVLGAGGNSRDIIDTIADINDYNGLQYECLGILDDDKSLINKEVMGMKVLGPIADAYKYPECFFVNGIYSVINFFTHIEVINKSMIPLNKFETIIHPQANISRTAKIGRGSVILRNATVMSNVVIGKHVVVNPGAVVSHDNVVSDYSFIAGLAATGGYVKIGKACFIGAGSSIKGWVKIGEFSIVGMGSVVLENIPKNCIYVGSPAKLLRKSR